MGEGSVCRRSGTRARYFSHTAAKQAHKTLCQSAKGRFQSASTHQRRQQQESVIEGKVFNKSLAASVEVHALRESSHCLQFAKGGLEQISPAGKCAWA